MLSNTNRPRHRALALLTAAMLAWAIGFSAWAASAAAYPAGTAPTLSILDPSPCPGVTANAIGVGFQPGESVQLSLDGAAISTFLVDSAGSFDVTYTLPVTTATGQHALSARGDQTNIIASTEITVQHGHCVPIPSATINTTNPDPGGRIVVTVSGCAAGPIVVELDDTIIGTATIPASGDGQVGGNVPGDASGKHIATAICFGGSSASFDLTIKSGGLAFTGFAALSWSAVALVVIAAGATLVALGRRRRRAHALEG
jgi:hypothetical protein